MDSQDLIKQLAAEVTPVKPVPKPLVLAARWTLLATVYVLFFIYLFGARPDIAARLADPLFAAEIILFIATLIACIWSSVLLAYPDNYQIKRPLATPIASFTLLVCMLYAQWVHADPSIATPMHGVSCTIHITLLSLAPAALLFFSISRMASTHYVKAGAVAMLSAFSMGGIVARFTEMTDSIEHIVQWHYLPILAAAILGTLLGRFLLKW